MLFLAQTLHNSSMSPVHALKVVSEIRSNTETAWCHGWTLLTAVRNAGFLGQTI